jgi:hypothetical protein
MCGARARVFVVRFWCALRIKSCEQRVAAAGEASEFRKKLVVFLLMAED